MAEHSEIPYISILRQAFDDRIARNERYSLRAYARDLEMSPSALSGVFNGHKGLSAEQAAKIAKRIDLTEMQSRLFILSVKAKHERSSRQRASASASFKSLERRHILDAPAFDPISNWYYFALLELTEFSNCEHTAEWFANRLGLDQALVKRALAQLVQHGHMKLKKKCYRALTLESIALTSKPTDSFKKYHREILEKAMTSLVRFYDTGHSPSQSGWCRRERPR